MRQILALSIVAIALMSTGGAAQDIPGMARPPILIQQARRVPYRDNLISVNPIGVVLQYYSGQYEHALSPEFSLALNGSYFTPDYFDFNDTNDSGPGYVSADLIARFYPNAEGLRGFSIGGKVGYARVGRLDCVYTYSGGGYTTSCARASARTIGVEGDYNWVLGASQHFGVQLGLGAKRYFFNRHTSASAAIPTARASIGYAW